MKLLHDKSINLETDLAAIRAALTGKASSLSAHRPFDASFMRIYFVDDAANPFAVFDAVPSDLYIKMMYAALIPDAKSLPAIIHIAAFDKNECLGVLDFPVKVVIWASVLLAEYAAMDMRFFDIPAIEAVRQKLIERGEYPVPPPVQED